MTIRIAFAEHEPPGDGEHHRALRDDVRFRYVTIGGDGPEYELVHQDGTVDIEGGVLLIGAYAVPPGGDAAFLEQWRAVRAVLGGQRGYLGARLLRAVADTPWRWAATLRWSSPLMYARALALPELPAVGFPGELALYVPRPPSDPG
jgi:hypothetical protein